MSEHEDSTSNAVFVMDDELKYVATHAVDIEESDIELDAGPSSTTTPASSFRNLGLDYSPSLVPCSTPSSYTDASEMACSIQPVKLLSETKNIGVPLASIAEHTNQHAAATSGPTSCESIPVLIGLSDSSSNRRQNLWQRLKTNVRRSLSSDRQSRDSSPSKGRMNGMLSASKGLLTGNSNPDLRNRNAKR